MNLFDLFITQPILNLLLTIYQFVGDFGVSIILFALIVKLAIWPITRNNLKQSKKIRDLQPEISKIRRETKGNRTAETMRIMELYRANDIKQFRTILMTIIQVSIFITLFTALNIVVRRVEILKFAYKPVAEFSRVQELTSDKAFNPKLFGIIRLDEKAIPDSRKMNKSSWFLMFTAIFSSWVQWYIVKQMNGNKKARKIRDIMKEAAEGKEADQAELNQAVSQNMSLLLPVMMFVMMVNLYGAITFYYFVSNLIQFIQQKYILNPKKEENPKLKNAKEAKIVENAPKKSGNVRRIKAKDNRREK